jgi:hypothetical protein
MNKLQITVTICFVFILLFLGFKSLKSIKVEDEKQTNQTVDDTARSLVSPIMKETVPVDIEQ